VLIFPAITFCLVDYNTDSISRNLKDVFISGYFDSINNTCHFYDFQKIKIFDPYFVKDFDCFKFNGGRNSNNEETALQMANFVETDGGLVLEFNLTINDTLLYHIDDNKVNPTNVELDNLIEVNNQDGKSVNIGIKKTVDKKLPIPYSNCTETIDSGTSSLVKDILAKGVTYRRKDCYEFCYYKFLDTFAVSNNVTKKEAFL
jgi:hypothetical protein